MTSSLPRFKAETELGPPVVEWLEEQGFDVYQEVAVGAGAIDIVGISGPLVVAVELKLQASWELLDQATHRRWCAHMVWAAVPYPKTGVRHVITDTFAHHGVGLLHVHRHQWSNRLHVAASPARPAFNRTAQTFYVRRALREENKTKAVAGSPAGARDWSEFKQTCRAVREIVRAKPGATIREVVAGLDHHHYATDAGARASLIERIGRGVVEGVRIRRDGAGPWRLYPTDAQEGEAA